MTPLETGRDGHPLTWVGVNPGQPSEPTQITLAIATYNYPTDQGIAPTFSGPLPDSFVPLLTAAEHAWEEVADIRFVAVPDAPNDSQDIPDIRVGVAELAKGIGDPPISFIGFTNIQWDATSDTFMPDVLLSIEDPMEIGVTKLANGDFLYEGEQATVFQDLLHEVGHAIGLDHNSNDPTSIMNPELGTQNHMPDSQDIAAIQSLYGAARGPLVLSASDAETLHTLVPGLSV